MLPRMTLAYLEVTFIKAMGDVFRPCNVPSLLGQGYECLWFDNLEVKG